MGFWQLLFLWFFPIWYPSSISQRWNQLRIYFYFRGICAFQHFTQAMKNVQEIITPIWKWRGKPAPDVANGSSDPVSFSFWEQMKYFIAPDYKRAFSFDKRFSKKVVLRARGKRSCAFWYQEQNDSQAWHNENGERGVLRVENPILTELSSSRKVYVVLVRFRYLMRIRA